MPYKSLHMQEPAPQLISSARNEVTMDYLNTMEFEELIRRHINLDGNTVYRKEGVIAAWVSTMFSPSAAAALLGTSSKTLNFRMCTIAHDDYHALVSMFMDYLNVDFTFAELLDKDNSTWHGHPDVKVYWCMRICVDALRKFGTRRETYRQLGITKEHFDYWYEEKDNEEYNVDNLRSRFN